MCLEVINCVTNWNKVKNNIYVRSKLQLFQLEIPIFINKLMCQSSLINSVSFVFCEFKRVASWNECKTIMLVRSSFQTPKQKHWFHIQGQPMLKVNMSFPNSNSEGIFSSYVFGKSFWNYRELKIDCWTSRHILCERNIKFFRMCGD